MRHPPQRDAWVARLDLENAAASWELEAALRREFARHLTEIRADPREAARRRHLPPHRDRLRAIFAAHYWATALTFGAIGREMLADGIGQKAEPAPGEDVRAVADRMASLRVSPERVERLAAALLASAAVVKAIEAALAEFPGDLDRATSRALKAPAVRLALAPPATLPPETPNAGPQPGTGAISPPKPPTPPDPPRPPTGGPPAKPPEKPPTGPTGGGGGRRDGRFAAYVAQYVREFAPARATRIAEASYRLVTEQVAEAARASEGPEKVAARLVKALEGEMSVGRARRIARTETVGAQNAALLAMADEDGREVRKQWVAVEDTATRPTHAAADGQVVEPGGRFIVGEARLLHPGDPSGPPGEIINCRCSMLLTTVRRRNPQPSQSRAR